jgi:hypothetical protein
MKTLIFALLVAALAIAVTPIASAYEWSTPQEQAAALRAARAILAQHGIRHVTLDRPCTYETKSSPPESVPHGYAVTWCNLSFTGAHDRVIPTPKNLPRYHVKQPTVAGFRYPPGFGTGGYYDDDTLEYVTPTTYHGAEGWGDPTLSRGDSVTINGTTYSVPS